MLRTVIRTATNSFATEQELSFVSRRELPPDMRLGCRESILKQMGDDPFLVNLGLDEPVSVTQDNFIEGQVEQAVCLIAYSDAEYDQLFFVYRSCVDGIGLAAVMGASYDISRCIDGYLEDDRYMELSWDARSKMRRQMFPLPDFATLYVDDGVNGEIAGAHIEGRLVSVGKMDVKELEFDRVPQLARDLSEVTARSARVEKLTQLTMPAELFAGLAA
ncbi:hypothetical protein [Scleromatobacter humisilvae]|uniref:Uncharacterized protein n=1 Tax=Scleromatobacter humisilvae TaxID=2897159 RepID=A0A9X1YKU8_9BURK|nr:hypothetical protein [Scleromatobacter humisilvae]MCK9687300.1 hypothetical protein [Scleromatobacter humisilvae]